MPDQDIVCVECGQTFIFTERDQEFFNERGYTPPKRCKQCRAKNKERTGRTSERVIECCPGLADLVRRRMIKAAGTHPLLIVHFGKQETVQIFFCPVCGKDIRIETPGR